MISHRLQFAFSQTSSRSMRIVVRTESRGGFRVARRAAIRQEDVDGDIDNGELEFVGNWKQLKEEVSH